MVTFVAGDSRMKSSSRPTVWRTSRQRLCGGFSPHWLVIGQNPRVPHQLLPDDLVDEVGL